MNKLPMFTSDEEKQEATPGKYISKGNMKGGVPQTIQMAYVTVNRKGKKQSRTYHLRLQSDGYYYGTKKDRERGKNGNLLFVCWGRLKGNVFNFGQPKTGAYAA